MDQGKNQMLDNEKIKQLVEEKSNILKQNPLFQKEVDEEFYSILIQELANTTGCTVEQVMLQLEQIKELLNQ